MSPCLTCINAFSYAILCDDALYALYLFVAKERNLE